MRMFSADHVPKNSSVVGFVNRLIKRLYYARRVGHKIPLNIFHVLTQRRLVNSNRLFVNPTNAIS